MEMADHQNLLPICEAHDDACLKSVDMDFSISEKVEASQPSMNNTEDNPRASGSSDSGDNEDEPDQSTSGRGSFQALPAVTMKRTLATHIRILRPKLKDSTNLSAC